jgi:hypothetical protein
MSLASGNMRGMSCGYRPTDKPVMQEGAEPGKRGRKRKKATALISGLEPFFLVEEEIVKVLQGYGLKATALGEPVALLERKGIRVLPADGGALAVDLAERCFIDIRAGEDEEAGRILSLFGEHRIIGPGVAEFLEILFAAYFLAAEIEHHFPAAGAASVATPLHHEASSKEAENGFLDSCKNVHVAVLRLLSEMTGVPARQAACGA